MEGKSRIKKIGKRKLTMIDSKVSGVGRWKTWLTNYQFDTQCPDDEYIWFTCVLALEATTRGNFGVGCVLTDFNGELIAYGQNETFKPYFRGDRHAEMVVMNKFESDHRDATKLEGYTLYTSVESCPMCLTRLIISGIETVLHASPNINSGMVHKMSDLPSVWIRLAQKQVYSQARCSQELINAANEIYRINSGELRKKLQGR